MMKVTKYVNAPEEVLRLKSSTTDLIYQKMRSNRQVLNIP